MPNLSALESLKDVVICGDLNAKHPLWLSNQSADTRGNLLLSQSGNLTIINDPSKNTETPQRISDNPTSPDITLCSPHLATTINWSVIYDTRSDHNPILLKIKREITRKKKKPVYIYNLANWQLFRSLTDQQFANIKLEDFTSLDAAVAYVNKIILEARAKTVPQRHASYTCNYGRKSLVKERNRLKKVGIRTSEARIRLKVLNDEIKASEFKTQRAKWSKVLTSLNRNRSTSEIWKSIRNIWKANEETPGDDEFSQKDLNALIKYYAKISHKDRMKTDPSNPPLRKLKSKHSTHFTEKEVLESLRQTKVTYSHGPDGIPIILLKNIGNEGISVLTKIYNWSINHNSIPTIWKLANIRPILKSGKPKQDQASLQANFPIMFHVKNSGKTHPHKNH
ncbi:uncharacterized protein LOC115228103 [Octopus sinensis]|uniref:Uncharacterized protein LOC115228103 n=1 Tax=Octopus sinensis TaxID=2607531 RepID=A0A6P7U0X5_9MOLL|nr:uncharacterized protein LOC115228103 [Octopus sinensis]